MKTPISLFTLTLFLVFSMSSISFAQDDVYYDPNKDPAKQSTSQPNENDNNALPQEEPVDKTDGYGNNNDSPPSKYEERQNSEAYQENGNTYITNNYYDDDDDDWGYTTRLHRYYTPNYGVNYYSYWFTPSFYFGWNSWNSAYMVSLNPWYSDPWWSWNRRNVVVMYDPFFDPYWSYNFGWNSCAFYNSWSNPYGGYGCGFNNWGYGGWGGYGGYGGYNRGYWNGYNHGYYDGYNDGYWNGTAYNNNTYYYSGPRRHRMDRVTATSPVTTSPGTPGTTKAGITDKPKGELVIPKEGIQRPINNAPDMKSGVKIQPENTQPYNPNNPNVVTKPVPGGANEKLNPSRPRPDEKGAIRQPQPGAVEQRNPAVEREVPSKTYRAQPEQPAGPELRRNPKERNDFPDNRYDRPQPNENPNMRSRPEPEYNRSNTVRPREEVQPEVRPRMERSEPQRMEQPRQAEPRNYEQPRRMETPRSSPQPQQQERRMEMPRGNSQPQMQRMEQPQNNMRQAAPQQRNFSPSQGGGGMRRRP